MATQLSPLQKLGRQIGATTIDHAAHFVRTGMFAGAVDFFTEALDWAIVRTAGDIKELGWRAVFLAPHIGDPVMLQLTEDTDHPETPVIFPGAHLGIKVLDAEASATAIKDHYERAGLTCEIEQVGEGKWFVRLPELFTFTLELVTAPQTFNWQLAARSDLIEDTR